MLLYQMMYRHLAGKAVPFELEVSVDETETPTRRPGIPFTPDQGEQHGDCGN